MKKIILAGALSVMASSSFAASSDAGCGLGTMIFEGNQGLLPSVFAATTNGTFANQTFGMSSGTLGCTNELDGGLWAMETYLDSNLDKVASDMSRGQGETLDGLAEVMGIEASDKEEFFTVSKNNFDRIFSSGTATRAEVVVSLKSVMSESDSLSKYVS